MIQAFLRGYEGFFTDKSVWAMAGSFCALSTAILALLCLLCLTVIIGKEAFK